MRIFKVQLPRASNFSNPPALLYDKSRDSVYIPVKDLPESVLNAVKANGGKGFFLANINGGVVTFGDEVPDPGW